MMRLLLGGLIVLNVLVFLYGNLGLERERESRVVRQHKPDVGSIRLVSARVGVSAGEVESLPLGEEATAVAVVPEEAPLQEPSGPMTVEEGEDPAPAVERVSAVPPTAEEVSENEERMASASHPVAAPMLFCGEIGPFRNRAQARRVERHLGVDEKTRIYRRPTLVNTAYWVYRPPLDDRAQAREEVSRLKEAGIEDLWLMPDGDFRNAISLGLYSRREAAHSRVETLKEKGFEVEVRPKQKELERYWLQFTDLPEGLLAELDGSLPEGASVEKKVCEQASAAP